MPEVRLVMCLSDAFPMHIRNPQFAITHLPPKPENWTNNFQLPTKP
jgi:hypothetical protein